MNAVTEQQDLAEDRGLYDKFDIRRTDGSSDPGGKHHGNFLFAMNTTTDIVARRKVKEYAQEIEGKFPKLAADIRAKLRAMMPSEFVTVPETTLPNGTVVPAFEISRFLCTVEDGAATVQADAVPTVEITYDDAVKACDVAGWKLIRETQELALARNIYNVDANWTGGKVGDGDLRQGLRHGTVDGAQSNDYIPEDDDERRTFILSNGEVIHDVASHLFTWVFDDVQGDEQGLIAKPFAENSPSITTAPHPSRTRGMGWQPKLPCNWSGYALIRGGGWNVGDRAGVFRLNYTHPGYGRNYVGFRSTK